MTFQVMQYLQWMLQQSLPNLLKRYDIDNYTLIGEKRKYNFIVDGMPKEGLSRLEVFY